MARNSPVAGWASIPATPEPASSSNGDGSSGEEADELRPRSAMLKRKGLNHPFARASPKRQRMKDDTDIEFASANLPRANGGSVGLQKSTSNHPRPSQPGSKPPVAIAGPSEPMARPTATASAPVRRSRSPHPSSSSRPVAKQHIKPENRGRPVPRSRSSSGLTRVPQRSSQVVFEVADSSDEVSPAKVVATASKPSKDFASRVRIQGGKQRRRMSEPMKRHTRAPPPPDAEIISLSDDDDAPPQASGSQPKAIYIPVASTTRPASTLVQNPLAVPRPPPPSSAQRVTDPLDGPKRIASHKPSTNNAALDATTFRLSTTKDVLTPKTMPRRLPHVASASAPRPKGPGPPRMSTRTYDDDSHRMDVDENSTSLPSAPRSAQMSYTASSSSAPPPTATSTKPFVPLSKPFAPSLLRRKRLSLPGSSKFTDIQLASVEAIPEPRPPILPTKAVPNSKLPALFRRRSSGLDMSGLKDVLASDVDLPNTNDTTKSLPTNKASSRAVASSTVKDKDTRPAPYRKSLLSGPKVKKESSALKGKEKEPSLPAIEKASASSSKPKSPSNFIDLTLSSDDDSPLPPPPVSATLRRRRSDFSRFPLDINASLKSGALLKSSLVKSEPLTSPKFKSQFAAEPQPQPRSQRTSVSPRSPLPLPLPTPRPCTKGIPTPALQPPAEKSPPVKPLPRPPPRTVTPPRLVASPEEEDADEHENDEDDGHASGSENSSTSASPSSSKFSSHPIALPHRIGRKSTAPPTSPAPPSEAGSLSPSSSQPRLALSQDLPDDVRLKVLAEAPHSPGAAEPMEEDTVPDVAVAGTQVLRTESNVPTNVSSSLPSTSDVEMRPVAAAVPPPLPSLPYNDSDDELEYADAPIVPAPSILAQAETSTDSAEMMDVEDLLATSEQASPLPTSVDQSHETSPDPINVFDNSDNIVQPRRSTRSSRSTSYELLDYFPEDKSLDTVSSSMTSPTPDDISTPTPNKVFGGFESLSWRTFRQNPENFQPNCYFSKDLPHTLQDTINSFSDISRRHRSLASVMEAAIRENTAEDEPDAPLIEIINEVDDDPTPPWEFHYSNKMWLGEGVPLPDVSGLIHCNCVGRCDPKSKTCACVQRQHEWVQREFPSPDFIYNSKGQIKTTDYPVFECNDRCGCGDECRNRVVQHGRKCAVRIQKTEEKGWGVFAGAKKIYSGSFIGVYAGELLTDTAGEQRGM
ncbi:hypothetical protein H0H87_010305 [Tephrocybe sp. NHM501043]|nr:hypothetical protein H0H87_010305 [Tephrocybe sp. NHM501043]